LLAELGEELVSVHGQSDQQRLLRPARQRDALDRYAGAAVLAPLELYRQAYAELRRVEAALDELRTRADERAREADLLRVGLAEIERVAPQAGEEVRLAAEAQRLGHVEELRSAAERAHEALSSDSSRAVEHAGPDANSLVGLARQALEPVRTHDPDLAAIGDRLAELSYLLADVAGDLAAYTAGVDADPTRLAAVEERRAELLSLTRRHAGSTEDVLAWAERSALRLLELESDDERIGTLAAERARLATGVRELAGRITHARQEAAARFGEEVTTELVDLAMPHARLVVEVLAGDAEDETAYGPAGLDSVELQLAAHPGAPARSIGAGASGGELSRVMLAVEVVFAKADPVPTAVFDEVDAGVGGRAAVEVGARLARLARTTQVLVVTHLPQVAAYADRHLMVAKSSDGSVTRSGVTVLEGEARVRELTRMLAGLEGSETGAAHARELLDSASALKGGSAPG
jgi:DNA repair protein RecN (Recombination protein N)